MCNWWSRLHQFIIHTILNNFFDAVKKIDKIRHILISGYWIELGQHSELVKANELIKHLKQ